MLSAQSADFHELVDGDDYQIENLPDPEKQNQDASGKAVANRGKIYFIDARTIAALDKSKVSSENAVHIATAIAAALGHNIQDLVISKSSIDRCRVQYREEIARIIKDDFNDTVI